MDKKFMMDKMGSLTRKGIFLIHQTRILASASAMAAALCTGAAAHAEEERPPSNVKILKYQYGDLGNEKDYQIAWDAMNDLYKDSQSRYDKTLERYDLAQIWMATYDLNGDGQKEIIARPVEEMHEEGMFCQPGTGLCPHYIIQPRGDEIRVLAVIYADSLDVGKEFSNGYKTLHAFTMESEYLTTPKLFSFYDTYEYNPADDNYLNSFRMPGAKKEDTAKTQ
jgi:hypothetical protein